MSRHWPKYSLFMVASTLSLTIACGPSYTGVELSAVTSPPLEVTLDDEVVVPEGILVAVHVDAFNTSGSYEADSSLTLSARNSKVLAVAATAEPRTYVLVGAHQGTTCIVVRIDGQQQECLRARVTRNE